MKILVIFTGGTIGSSVNDGWIAPNDDMKYMLINRFREKTDIDVQFETMVPYTILSENLSAENLNRLIECVRENINGFDGIIVTHGTDTLQYTAAALAYAFGCDCTPVVLVSSNYPLDDNRANGLDNFIAAVEFITAKAGRGVFVSYKNKDEITKIHLASRIASHVESSDEIYSIDNQPYAFYNEKIILNPDFIAADGGKPLSDAYFCHDSQILSIVSMPGDAFCYNLDGYKAVILRPYHSGTLNTNSKEFADFCYNAKNNNIPVFVVNVHGGITYESAKEYKKLGLIVLPFCSFVSIYVKIWLGISRKETLVSYVYNKIAGEFCDFV